MSKSVYHILHKVPIIDEYDIEAEYEELAKELVNSGLLRIDTDHQSNFVRYTDPLGSLNITASDIELSDPKLLSELRKTASNFYDQNKIRQSTINKKLDLAFADLQNQKARLNPINSDIVIKLARLFVQSAHPIVIRWLLHDKVQIFITYSHSIGDVMEIKDWKQSGNNSGMQSFNGKDFFIFVSCGGDPFAPNSDKQPLYGNGWAAVSRLQIIAAQEIGHYADIIRNNRGEHLGRHSANFSGTLANENIKLSRKIDLTSCDTILGNLMSAGLRNLIRYERELKFYHEQKIKNIRTFYLGIKIKLYKNSVIKYACRNNLLFIKQLQNEQYMSLMILMMVDDMKFNLNPIADVYKRSDKNAEEAIKCIEALARVPQQVIKWGHLATIAFMKNLYQIYYNQVIPSLVENYNHLKEIEYKRSTVKKHKWVFGILKKQFISSKNTNHFNPIRTII
jgi:hypothetical protein